jgi:hypothetical protein
MDRWDVCAEADAWRVGRMGAGDVILRAMSHELFGGPCVEVVFGGAA